MDLVQPLEKRTPRRADAVENAERVLEAARELYDEQGTQAEMREIAARAGVGVGTVYRNFPTKDDLTNALLVDMLDRWQDDLLVAESIADPFDALRRLISSQQEMIDRHAWIAELQFRPQLLQTDTIARLREVADMHHAATERILQRAVDRGMIRSDVDIPLLAGVLVGASQPHAFERVRGTKSVDQIIDDLFSLFLQGIGPQHSPEISPNPPQI